MSPRTISLPLPILKLLATRAGCILAWLAAGCGAVLLLSGCEPAPPPPSSPTPGAEAAGEGIQEPFASYLEGTGGSALCVVFRPLRREPVPVVVLAHQLSSELRQPSPPMVRLAEKLAHNGIATMRIYYDSSPASADVAIEYTTPREMLGELESIFSQLEAQQNWVDIKRVGLVGFDIGALLSVNAAATTSFQPRALVLWSPPTDYETGFTNFLGHPPGSKKILVHFEDRRVVLTGSFFDHARELEPLEDIRKFNGLLLGITGSESTFGLAALRQYIANSGASAHDTLVLEGSNADLGLDGKDAEATEKAIEATADWLIRAL